MLNDQAQYLTILHRTPASAVKQFAEELLPALGPVDVVQNRTGLVMLPATDSVTGTAFYLGEVLVAEALVRVGDAQGYAGCLGRDLEQALAIALVDAACTANLCQDQIAAFVTIQADEQARADAQLLRRVDATRVEMETF